jgi:hypothetical protein
MVDCHCFCDLRETTVMADVQIFIVFEADTLHSLLMLKGDMSQASLRSIGALRVYSWCPANHVAVLIVPPEWVLARGP